MKVGDVVRLKEYCIDGGRQAIIIDNKRGRIHVVIAYFDTGEAAYAYRSNLEPV
jgi:predicted type IV restriction endonuclease